MKISVIIPMYNESKIIADTAKRLSEYMTNHFENYEILFSDDGSKDGSADCVRALKLPCVRVTGYSENKGKGSAIRHAMLEADGDLILFTDADLAYGTDVIAEAVATYQSQCDKSDVHLMIGSRNLGKDGYDGYSWYRKIMSKTYIRLLGFLGGFRLTDSQCGFKVFRRDAAKDIFSRCKVNGFSFDFEVILWAEKLGYNIIEMPVRVIHHRASKIHIFKDSIRMMRDVQKIKKSVKKASKNKTA